MTVCFHVDADLGELQKCQSSQHKVDSRNATETISSMKESDDVIWQNVFEAASTNRSRGLAELALFLIGLATSDYPSQRVSPRLMEVSFLLYLHLNIIQESSLPAVISIGMSPETHVIILYRRNYIKSSGRSIVSTQSNSRRWQRRCRKSTSTVSTSFSLPGFELTLTLSSTLATSLLF
jgi:hypothetical protein